MDVNAPPHIFPTHSRSKHAKDMSFPVGAEILSRALDGVQQHSALRCVFSGGSSHHDTGREVLYLMSVGYTKQARSHFDSGDAGARGVYDHIWEIWCHTVPNTLRSEVKQALLETGFPTMVRPWLMENAGLEGKTGSAGIILEYNRIDRKLIATIAMLIEPEKAR